MSDEKTYTAADMRGAIISGAHLYWRVCDSKMRCFRPSDFEAEAERLYPEPPKPREREASGDRYRVVDGNLEVFLSSGWAKSAWSEDAKVWADLLAHPYEESKP